MKEPGEVFTPKDYAEWLVNEMENQLDEVHIFRSAAKQCALTAVKSVMDSTRMLVNHYIKSNGIKAYMDIGLSKNLTLTYWREVIKEIEKL
jgi:hypothetical protein